MAMRREQVGEKTRDKRERMGQQLIDVRSNEYCIPSLNRLTPLGD
jgi:hypothetical protein